MAQCHFFCPKIYRLVYFNYNNINHPAALSKPQNQTLMKTYMKILNLYFRSTSALFPKLAARQASELFQQTQRKRIATLCSLGSRFNYMLEPWSGFV